LFEGFVGSKDNGAAFVTLADDLEEKSAPRWSTFTQAGQEQLKQSYKKLIGLTQAVRAQASGVLKALETGQLTARPEAFLKVLAAEASLKHYLPLVAWLRWSSPRVRREFSRRRHGIRTKS